MDTPLAIRAGDAPLRVKKSNYPPEFARRMEGRSKHPLGDLFGLSNFGVNLTTLAPGAVSALLHRHSRQDEFIYVLKGEITLVTDRGTEVLTEGMCAGFAAGGVAHNLENRSTEPATYLEIGDRTPGDEVAYPADDLQAVLVEGAWQFTHKDGRPY